MHTRTHIHTQARPPHFRGPSAASLRLDTPRLYGPLSIPTFTSPSLPLSLPQQPPRPPPRVRLLFSSSSVSSADLSVVLHRFSSPFPCLCGPRRSPPLPSPPRPRCPCHADLPVHGRQCLCASVSVCVCLNVLSVCSAMTRHGDVTLMRVECPPLPSFPISNAPTLAHTHIHTRSHSTTHAAENGSVCVCVRVCGGVRVAGERGTESQGCSNGEPPPPSFRPPNALPSRSLLHRRGSSPSPPLSGATATATAPLPTRPHSAAPSHCLRSRSCLSLSWCVLFDVLMEFSGAMRGAARDGGPGWGAGSGWRVQGPRGGHAGGPPELLACLRFPPVPAQTHPPPPPPPRLHLPPLIINDERLHVTALVSPCAFARACVCVCSRAGGDVFDPTPFPFPLSLASITHPVALPSSLGELLCATTTPPPPPAVGIRVFMFFSPDRQPASRRERVPVSLRVCVCVSLVCAMPRPSPSIGCVLRVRLLPLPLPSPTRRRCRPTCAVAPAG